jgi:hypothetical protein
MYPYFHDLYKKGRNKYRKYRPNVHYIPSISVAVTTLDCSVWSSHSRRLSKTLVTPGAVGGALKECILHQLLVP